MSIDDHDNSIQVPFTIYTIPMKCYNCGKTTNILTYIKYGDNLTEDVLYPWDMNPSAMGSPSLSEQTPPYPPPGITRMAERVYPGTGSAI